MFAPVTTRLRERRWRRHWTCMYIDSRVQEQMTWHVKVKVTLRPTVSRPVRHGVRLPSRTRDQFFFLLEIFF
jgi:hypothetical protein